MKGRKDRLFKGVIYGLIIGILLCFISASIFCCVQIKKAPDINTLSLVPDGYLTTILDEGENVVDYLYTSESNRIYVPLDEISINLQNAFIAVEDVRFYQHHGIDIKGILRAFFKGICHGNFSQGASTITQQLIKNNVFKSWVYEDSLYEKVCRKIQEQHLARKVEANYTKAEILEYYLNTINLGAGTRGVQVASMYYFQKNASDLSIAEAALIAGITKNPSAYNPIKHPERSRERQKTVLDVMLRQGFIDQREYEDAIKEDIIHKINVADKYDNHAVFSWFEDVLIDNVVNDLINECHCSSDEAWNLLYSGGLTIYSTLNVSTQHKCEEIAMCSSNSLKDEEVSIVVMDPKTGDVRAIVGGREEKQESLSYNRAVKAVRQPGSIISVLGEYAAAIDTGSATLGTIVEDAPYSFQDGTVIDNIYKEYQGKTTIHKAIAISSNIVALKILQKVGIETTYSYLHLFRLNHIDEADKYESLALGRTHNGVTNLEITTAYGAIANGGVYNEARFYTKVTDQMGNVILENIPLQERIIKESTAELLTIAMEDAIKDRVRVNSAFENISIAGKKGTTSDNRDGWFIGFSPYYACGVWGGFDDYSGQKSADYVNELWIDLMKALHENKENMVFSTNQLSNILICSKCGKLAKKGVCEKSLQKNVVYKEYYENGTLPTAFCDCHILIDICKESELRKGANCPASGCRKEVFLISGTEGTDDYQYVYPGALCDVHKEANKTEDQVPENTSDDEKSIFDTIIEWYRRFSHIKDEK